MFDAAMRNFMQAASITFKLLRWLVQGIVRMVRAVIFYRRNTGEARGAQTGQSDK